MAKRKLKRKYKTYTDPYAKDWYMSIYRPSDWDAGGTIAKQDRQQAALVAADYIESMYRHHQRKYLHNRDSVENSPNFVGPVSPKNYISPNTKEALQFENFDSRFYGTYNDNYPNMPTDYDKYKYKYGGNKRNKSFLGTALLIGSGIGALTNLITSGISASNQRKQFEESNRQTLLQNKLNNIFNTQQNRHSVMNSNIADENEFNKTEVINTLSSAMRCGGKRRMKKNGGNVTADISKFGLYI